MKRFENVQDIKVIPTNGQCSGSYIFELMWRTCLNSQITKGKYLRECVQNAMQSHTLAILGLPVQCESGKSVCRSCFKWWTDFRIYVWRFLNNSFWKQTWNFSKHTITMRASRGRIPNINYISSKFLWQNTTAHFLRWQKRKQWHYGCHGQSFESIQGKPLPLSHSGNDGHQFSNFGKK